MVRITRKHAEELLHQDQYTPRELAALLGTTEDYLSHEVWRRNLVANKLGHDIYRFRRSDVLEWLSRRERDRS